MKKFGTVLALCLAAAAFNAHAEYAASTCSRDICVSEDCRGSQHCHKSAHMTSAPLHMHSFLRHYRFDPLKFAHGHGPRGLYSHENGSFSR